MRKITNCYLNVRMGMPDTTADCVEYLSPGMTVEVVETIAGTMIEGNNTWYKDALGNYYWSGGFQENDFVDRLVLRLQKGNVMPFLSAADRKSLSQIKEIVGIGWTKEQGFFKVLIYCSQAVASLPARVLIELSESERFIAPVKVIITTVFKAHTTLTPSDSIKNKNVLIGADDVQNIGSLGYFVKVPGQDKPQLLTCYHVVRDDWNDFDIEDDGFEREFEIRHVLGNISVGVTVGGCINNEIDAALVMLNDDIRIDPRIPLLGEVLDIKLLVAKDFEAKLPVMMYGGKSSFRAGYCAGILEEAYISYGFTTKKLTNLIIVKSEGLPFSQGGDSGSLVIDANNHAIGLLVAGSEEASVVIPIKRILDKFKVHLLINKP